MFNIPTDKHFIGACSLKIYLWTSFPQLLWTKF